MSFNKEHKEDPLEIRPRFKLEVENTFPNDLLTNIQKIGKMDESLRVVKTYGTHLDIHMARKEESFWSPVMQLNFEEAENKGNTRIRCLIGPQQSHWLMFVFIYGILSVLGFFAGTYGLTKYIQSGEHTIWLYTFPVSMVIIFAIYLMVKMAQKSKHEQIVHLVKFLYKQIDHLEFSRVS